MAAVRRWKLLTGNLAAKILSLAMAAIFWFTVTIEKETIKSFSVPVSMINIPPGLMVSGNLPGKIDVTVTGPRILFFVHPVSVKTVTLDLQKTGQGTVVFNDLQKCVRVPYGFRIIRVFPSGLELKLVER